MYLNLCIWIYVFESMYLNRCIWIDVFESMYLNQCIWIDVFESMYLNRCIWIYVFESMYLNLCILIYVFESMYLNLCIWNNVFDSSMWLYLTVMFMTIVNGGWTSWEGWTSCSVSCGSGQRRRFRSCSDPSPANGGNTCGRVNAQYQSCNQQRCPGMHLLGQIKFQLTQSN